MEKVIAIFDIGKTNKKVLLFNDELKVVYQQEASFPNILDDDGFECDDIDLIVNWIKSTVEKLISGEQFDLLAINFSTYGATLTFLDENGNLITPLYNYLKPMPSGIEEPFYENYGGKDEFCRCTASPALGMLNSGFQILWLKKCKADIFKKVRNIIHFPQYLSYCFTGKMVSEYTSIGCHTALWDFDSKKYHRWLSDEGINLPSPVSNDTVFKVNILDKLVEIGIGIHDSSASLVPYLNYSKGNFILISTGTWCIFMNPFNSESLTKEQLNKDTLCYISTLERQVKSSRLFLGHIHDVNSKRISEHFNVETNFYQKIKLYEYLIRKCINESSKGPIFFKKGIPSNYIDEAVDLSMFDNCEAAYYQLMVDLVCVALDSLQLIISKEDSSSIIYISGGFAQNEIFLKILAAKAPQKRIFTSEINNATALGAALAIYEKTFKKTYPELNLGMREYESFI